MNSLEKTNGRHSREDDEDDSDSDSDIYRLHRIQDRSVRAPEGHPIRGRRSVSAHVTEEVSAYIFVQIQCMSPTST